MGMIRASCPVTQYFREYACLIIVAIGDDLIVVGI